MKITDTKIEGAYLIDIEPIIDDRGFFTRLWDKDRFENLGFSSNWVQGNLSLSKEMGTLRGLHYQVAPYEEAKLVRCIRGAIFDVILDLRWDSSTHMQWFGVQFIATEHRMIYIPQGCAHGFLTLVDDCEVEYLVSQYYHPEAEAGVRYNDPAFGIEWPTPIRIISEKDTSWPAYPGRYPTE
jgi:dTDP-4-dehydrorhamnose 3,5-epimerase